MCCNLPCIPVLIYVQRPSNLCYSDHNRKVFEDFHKDPNVVWLMKHASGTWTSYNPITMLTVHQVSSNSTIPSSGRSIGTT